MIPFFRFGQFNTDRGVTFMYNTMVTTAGSLHSRIYSRLHYKFITVPERRASKMFSTDYQIVLILTADVTTFH
jgi:hypothetical protein